MNRTVKVKLLPTPEQEDLLKRTSAVFVEVCNWISGKAFLLQEFRKNQLQKLVYGECRSSFPGFSSQLVVRAIDAVCQSYKLDKRHQREFRKDAATVYDQRVLSFDKDKCSIWTTGGRLEIPIRIWNEELFGRHHGQSDLVHSGGKWFLHVSVWGEDKEPRSCTEFIGVDMGVVNIAVTSDGAFYTGDAIERKRKKYHDHRQRLQSKGTKSARRRIRRIGRREARFRRDVNHIISKEIVHRAKGTCRGIAIEDLKGINRRTTVRKAQRNQRMGWSFHQLGGFLEYKAADAGIRFIKVNPRDTSKMCSRCRHVDKRNRKSQAEFKCLKCGHGMNADINAAINISARAVVNQPIVSW